VSSNLCTKGQEQELEVARITKRVLKLKLVFTKDHVRVCCIVTDTVSEAVRIEVSWKIVCANELIVIEDAADKCPGKRVSTNKC